MSCRVVAQIAGMQMSLLSCCFQALSDNRCAAVALICMQLSNRASHQGAFFLEAGLIKRLGNSITYCNYEPFGRKRFMLLRRSIGTKPLSSLYRNFILLPCKPACHPPASATLAGQLQCQHTRQWRAGRHARRASGRHKADPT